jgi:uncharacterized surface protein with fasciclin (FAS1) repeats
MSPFRIVTLAAASALIAGSAMAQAPAADAAPAAPAAEAAPAADAAPPAPPSAAAQAFQPLSTAPSGDLAATLQAAGQFSKFLAAAEKTGLGALLKGQRELTLFVPTDAAFDALPAGQLDQLMAANPPAQLQGLVVYHIVATKIAPEQVNGAKGPIPTASQKPVDFDGSLSPMKVNDAVVLQANVPASNGVIYVIDKVLTPPA